MYKINGKYDSLRSSLNNPVSPEFDRIDDSLRKSLSEIGESFSDAVVRIMREKGILETTCYKRAEIDRRLFSKIKSSSDYHPSKDTAIALIIGLQLSLQEATDLLNKCGYTLSDSIPKDIIIKNFLSKGIFDIDNIDEVLEMLGQKPIGNS